MMNSAGLRHFALDPHAAIARQIWAVDSLPDDALNAMATLRHACNVSAIDFN
jgi:hypothetical protein